MRFLALFDLFSGNHVWLTALAILLFAAWVFGKRFMLPARSSIHHSLWASVADLIATTLMLLLLGSLVRSLLAEHNTVLGPDQISDATLLLLLLFAAKNTARIVELFLLSNHKQDDLEYLPGLQRGLLFGGFLFLGLVTFLYIQGYSITGLYISTGAVAALVAFAMQQTLGDLFSGIALSIEHPFKLGERIRLADGSEGKVIDINWRATRLLAWDNSTLVVPNSELAKQGFTNLHGSDHVYAPWYEVKVPAEVDPRLAQALLLEAALRCSKILKDPLPLVRLTDATTVPYTYLVWVHFPNYPSMFAGREQLFQEIHYALKEVGAQVSPSINELHTRRAEATFVEPPTTILALKMLDIFKSLSDEDVEKLAEMSMRKTFEAGEIVVHQGEVAPSVDVILHGIVGTSVLTKAGVPMVLDQLRSGQYFGLTSMLMKQPSFLTFTASTKVTLVRINIECLKHVLTDRDDLKDEFAMIMKQRMERAQDLQLISDEAAKRFTLRDFLRRMEQWRR